MAIERTFSIIKPDATARNLTGAVNALIEAAPDAIQLTVGQAVRLQSQPARPKPALVLRTDTANVYGRELPRTLFSRLIGEPVEVGELTELPGERRIVLAR